MTFVVHALDGRTASLPGASDLPCVFAGWDVAVDALYYYFEPELYDEDDRLYLLISLGGFSRDPRVGATWVGMHPRHRDSVYAKAITKISLMQLVFNDDPVAALGTMLRKHFVGMPYAEYLQTPHWQGVREAALKAADYRCQVCYSPERVQIHHRTYDRRGRELPSDVTVLCADCHGRFHDKLPKVPE